MRPHKLTPGYWVKRAAEISSKDNSKTDWHEGTISPVHVGYYERIYTDGIYKHYWDGKNWRFEKYDSNIHWRQVGDYPAWRGITREHKEELDIIAINFHAKILIDLCKSTGHVVTISLDPNFPPAMGNYEMIVDVRKKRGAA